MTYIRDAITTITTASTTFTRYDQALALFSSLSNIKSYSLDSFKSIHYYQVIHFTLIQKLSLPS